MYSQRYRRDDLDHSRGRVERRRSRSRSRPRRHQRTRDSRTRSRSRSVERHRHRRSRSRGHSSRRERMQSSRHHRRSRSYSHSRSPTESHAHIRSRRSRSRTPKRTHRANSRERTHSTEHDDRSQPKKVQGATGLQTPNQQVPSNTTSASAAANSINLQTLPLPKAEPIGAYYNLDTEEPIDKERIHREIEEKLRQTLAKEGKVYPPPKPVASHPVFANDGSFLEIFKKMQEQQHIPAPVVAPAAPMCVAVTAPSPVYIPPTSVPIPTPAPLPVVGRRRGGKILKTGVVAKQKTQADGSADPKDFWALYLAEVNKYKNHACESESGTRPLVK